MSPFIEEMIIQIFKNHFNENNITRFVHLHAEDKQKATDFFFELWQNFKFACLEQHLLFEMREILALFENNGLPFKNLWTPLIVNDPDVDQIAAWKSLYDRQTAELTMPEATPKPATKEAITEEERKRILRQLILTYFTDVANISLAQFSRMEIKFDQQLIKLLTELEEKGIKTSSIELKEMILSAFRSFPQYMLRSVDRYESRISAIKPKKIKVQKVNLPTPKKVQPITDKKNLPQTQSQESTEPAAKTPLIIEPISKQTTEFERELEKIEILSDEIEGKKDEDMDSTLLMGILRAQGKPPSPPETEQIEVADDSTEQTLPKSKTTGEEETSEEVTITDTPSQPPVVEIKQVLLQPPTDPDKPDTAEKKVITSNIHLTAEAIRAKIWEHMPEITDTRSFYYKIRELLANFRQQCKHDELRKYLSEIFKLHKQLFEELKDQNEDKESLAYKLKLNADHALQFEREELDKLVPPNTNTEEDLSSGVCNYTGGRTRG